MPEQIPPRPTGLFPIAVYGDPGLPEYRENPLISALPPIMETAQVAKNIRRRPAFDEAERRLPGAVRVHAIARLLNEFFQPLSMHLELETKISLLIRGGYKGRNPATGTFNTHLQNAYERVVKGDLTAYVFDSATTTASSLALIGCSGCGKSTALSLILKSYPQVIFHPNHNITQLVYLKVDCPYNGGLKSLCMEFFAAVDKVAHTNYSKQYGQKRLSIPVLMAHMAQVATIHAIGILVIDEIQHLNQAKSGGQQDMLNFFVTLTNTIGIPVIMVGTPSARNLFELDLRSARRSAGLGSLYWERIPRDVVWMAFLKQLWKYQWLQNPEPLDDAMERAFFDHSQGVIDVVVKLFVLAQHRAIVTQAERLTPDLIKAVYLSEFKPVHPMLDALRSNRAELINKYGDLRMPDVTVRLLEVSHAINDTPQSVLPITKVNDKANQLVSLMTSMGMEQDVAVVAVDHVLAQHPTLPIATLVHKLTQYAVPAEHKDEAKAVSSSVLKQSQWSSLSPPDLRAHFSARAPEQEFYEVAKQHGVIMDLTSFIQ